MNRRQLAFLVLANAVISFVIALAVAWAIELRRPDPEALMANIAPSAQVINTTAPAAAVNSATTQTTAAQPQSFPTNTPDSSADSGTTISTATVETNTPTEVLEYYTVEAGDTLLGIAQRYEVSVDDLLRANDLSDPDFVFSGQRLAIPDLPNGSNASNTDDTSGTLSAIPEGIFITAVEGAGELTDENVLVVNESSDSFNLQGWTLSTQEGPIYTFGNLPLFPGGSIRIYSTTGTDSSIALYWGQTKTIWSAGSELRLVDGQGNLVDTYTISEE